MRSNALRDLLEQIKLDGAQVDKNSSRNSSDLVIQILNRRVDRLTSFCEQLLTQLERSR